MAYNNVKSQADFKCLVKLAKEAARGKRDGIRIVRFDIVGNKQAERKIKQNFGLFWVGTFQDRFKTSLFFVCEQNAPANEVLQFFIEPIINRDWAYNVTISLMEGGAL